MLTAKPPKAKRVSRSESKLESASLNQEKATRLPDKLKSSVVEKGTGKPLNRPSGVKGDSARVEISRGTWETRGRAGGIEFPEPRGTSNEGWESITAGSATEGVGQAHSSEEASNDRGAKGPD